MGKLTIESNIEEQDLIENLLNMKHSGIADNYLMLILGLHSMAHSWKFDKLNYYLKLLEIKYN